MNTTIFIITCVVIILLVAMRERLFSWIFNTTQVTVPDPFVQSVMDSARKAHEEERKAYSVEIDDIEQVEAIEAVTKVIEESIPMSQRLTKDVRIETAKTIDAVTKAIAETDRQVVETTTKAIEAVKKAIEEETQTVKSTTILPMSLEKSGGRFAKFTDEQVRLIRSATTTDEEEASIWEVKPLTIKRIRDRVSYASVV